MSEESNVDDIARILEQARPRPVPSDDAVASARRAVRSEWQALLKRRKRRRYWYYGAAAASVLVAFALFMAPQPPPVQVATIDRITGSIHVSTPAGVLQQATDLSALTVGQSLRTGKDSVAGLMLSSGSALRVAPDTSLAFLEDGGVELLAGKVYVDSKPHSLVASNALTGEPLFIRTRLGVVTHIGTQYMVELSDQDLVVSVRQGEVALDDAIRAVAGERLVTSGLGVDRSRVPPYGAAWRWMERATPTIDVEQQSADAFLRWVAHETGLEIDYLDDATASNASMTVLSGSIDAPPREALAAWVLAADYAYELDERSGVIRIRRR